MINPYTRPDWSAAALITIDMQRDFLDGQPFAIPGTSSVLPRIRSLLKAFRAAARPIIHMVRIYSGDGANADPCRRELIEKGGKLVLAGTPGSQLAVELLPQGGIELATGLLLNGGVQDIGPSESVIFKPRWGAFYQTPLEQRLGDQGISTLIICGCNFPNCPRTSIYEASERDFRIVLVDDAISGLYAQGRKEMDGIDVTLLPTQDVIAHIGT